MDAYEKPAGPQIFPFDVNVVDPLRLAPVDPDAAAALLLMAAKDLREGRQLPAMLAEYLADAFEASMQKPAKYRGKALLRELNFLVGNRRKKGDVLEIGQRFKQLVESGLLESQAAAQISAESEQKGGLSESAAIKLWKTYDKASKIRADVD